MPAGFECFNDGYFRSVNSEQLGMRYRARGSGACNDSSAGTAEFLPWVGYANIPVTAPMLAIRCSAPMFIKYRATTVLGTITIQATCATRYASFDWWAFDYGPPAVTGANVQLFNDQGALVWDGDDGVANIVGVINGEGSLSAGPGLTAAMITSNDRGDRLGFSGGAAVFDYQYLIHSPSANGVSVAIQQFLRGVPPAGYIPRAAAVPTTFLIDVTRFT